MKNFKKLKPRIKAMLNVVFGTFFSIALHLSAFALLWYHQGFWTMVAIFLLYWGAIIEYKDAVIKELRRLM